MDELNNNQLPEKDFTKVYLSELEDIKLRKGLPQSSKQSIQNEIDRINSKQLPECQQKGDEDRFGCYSVLPSTKAGLMGLALSGGGIRSATFNLGLLQALCNNNLLEKVDYLSTVSGGGYIGTCMTTLLNSHTKSIGLSTDTFPLGRRKIGDTGEPALEKDPVRRLRYFSNYLTAEDEFVPKYLRPAMVFLRGLVLNFFIIIPYIVTLGLLMALLFNIKILCPVAKNNHWFFDLREFSHSLRISAEAYNRANAKLREYAVQRTSHLNFDTDQERIEWVKGIDGDDEKLETLQKKIKTAKTSLKKEWWSIWILPGGVFASMVFAALFFRTCYSKPFAGRYKFSKFLAVLFFISIVSLVLQLYGILIAYWKTWEISSWIASASLLSLIAPKLLQLNNGNQGTGKKAVFKLILAIGLLLLVPLFILYLVGVIITYVTDGNVYLILSMISGTLILAYINRRFINLNEISLHNYYRDCLSKAYMMQCSRKSKAIFHRDGLKFSYLNPRKSPYHIFNTTLNLSKRMPEKCSIGNQRTGESFIFTKNWSGSAKTGYIITKKYATTDPHINVGTAMAISGAAANIGMAQKNIFVLRLLMGLLNIRLGYWALHPTEALKDTKNLILRDFPGSIQAFREWFGRYKLDSRYINLSDGGHFDNIGVYELLRRRCKYIIVGDAEADADMKFEALSYILRLARIDFGIEIDIDTTDIKPDHANGFSRNHCVVGRITYPEGDFGYLLYCKASLSGDEPEHLHEYKVKHPQFPHQTTADQWFDEQQFEAYRELGYHIGKEALAPLGATTKSDNEELFNSLKEFWYPHSESVEAHFTRHAVELNKIVSEIKNDEDLSFMDAQMYPEWESLIHQQSAPALPSSMLWLPSTTNEIRKGFYLCNLMIQLMENVYTDLNLEYEHNHPDNRGWMNLFRHWSWSGMFRVTWTICASTYGARFQKFCEKYLDLELGELMVEKHRNRVRAIKTELNPYERKVIKNFKRVNKFLFQTLFLFKLKVSDPLDQKHHKTFHFGFALVDADKKIIFFRVQDHLRQMGLGGRAFKELRDIHGIEKYSGELVEILKAKKDTDAILIGEQDLTRFERMCNQAGLSKSAKR